ncbi:hypothetical protein ACOSQ4_012119 [Xanthoceras sorbifolium]
MQQERGGSDNNKPQNQQDRRVKPMQGENNQPQQQCPRCESVNTKFCYYNNYSLSQPRYFCKTCRRYWTQGGTLRNVPVGGGCRKGKRTKSSSSGENSRSSQPPPPPPPQQVHQNLTTPQNILSSNPVITANPGLRSRESGPSSIPSMGSYYPGGGFLSSLALIQSLNQPVQSFSQPPNQALNLGGGDGDHDHLGGSSNLGLLQGYSIPSFGSPQQHQQIHQTQFLQMHPSEDQSLMNHSNRPGGSSSHHHHHQDWHQSFINSNTNPNVSDTALWSISTSTSTGNTNNNTNTGSASASASASLNPNQWPHGLQGYRPPP